MKTFIRRTSLVCGLLFTAVLCLGVVYIDTINNYWKFNGGFIQLMVNTNGVNTNGIVASFSVKTNTLRVGINTNNDTFGTMILGALPPPVQSALGDNANSTGAIFMKGGDGGSANRPTTATGGQGGRVEINGGAGGEALSAVTNATGGPGGVFLFSGGTGGGAATGVATNATTAGAGGQFNLSGGSGGSPSTPSTNTVGGLGGAGVLAGGSGGSPSAGWARKGGTGGPFTITGGAGGTGVRTNGGNGGAVTITGGAAGPVTSDGNAGAGAPGLVEILGGAGAVSTGGGTNSNGGTVFIAGGAPASGASPGDVVLARTSGGVSRGAGVQIGPILGGSVSITNVLGGRADLDFPSTAAGAVSDLVIAVVGVVSNNCAISLSVPWESASGGGAYSTFCSNDTVYVRFINNQLAAAIDPNPGNFTVVAFRIR